MAIIRSWAGRQGLPALKGRLMVDTYNGQMRARSWPRKRGKKLTDLQRLQTEWFAAAQRLYPRIPAVFQIAYMEQTKGTGLYPRDLFLKTLAGTAIPIQESDGRVITGRRMEITPVTWQGFMIEATANITVGTGVTVPITWPLPLTQTAPFWNAGAPTLITIPAGVTKICLEHAFRKTGGSLADDFTSINEPGVQNWTVVGARVPSTAGMYCSTGPIIVTPGQQFRCQITLASGGVLAAGPQTYFRGTILEAT